MPYGEKPASHPLCQGCVTKCRQHPVTGEWTCPRCDNTCWVPTSDQYTRTKWDINTIADLTDDL